MRKLYWLLAAGLPAFALLLNGACRPAPSSTPSAAQEPEYLPTATVKDLMLSVVDPAADVVWLSVTTVQNEDGLVETRPTSDEEWTMVRQGAITLAEARTC